MKIIKKLFRLIIVPKKFIQKHDKIFDIKKQDKKFHNKILK